MSVWDRRGGGRGGGGLLGSLGGIALGAALMYLLDARRGGARRAALRQQAAHAMRGAERLAGTGARDLSHRGRGLLAEVGAAFRRDPADDEVVAERVRARLGRLTPHAHAIRVAVRRGEVELRGPVLMGAEAHAVVEGVARVRGVRGVADRMERHAEGDAVPALQGGGERAAAGAARARWTPGPRLAAATAGAYLLARGVAGGGLLALPLAIVGVALLARAAANAPVAPTSGPPEIAVRKSVRIAQPVDEVYAFFTEFQNLPRFMTHVREVRAVGQDRTRWVVDGPGGVPIEWEARTTRLEPNRLVAWESVGGSLVRTAGVVRFEDDRGGTRMEVWLRYHPPAGALGHAIARLLGSDPKRQMNDDLVRLKSLLERGKATGREGPVTLDELKSASTMEDALHEAVVGDSGAGVRASSGPDAVARRARSVKGATARPDEAERTAGADAPGASAVQPEPTGDGG